MAYQQAKLPEDQRKIFSDWLNNLEHKELEIPESDWMDAADAIKKYGNIKQGWDHRDAPEFAMTFWYNDNNVFDEWVKDYFAGKKTKDDINKDLYDTNAWRATAHHFDAVESIGIVKDLSLIHI